MILSSWIRTFFQLNEACSFGMTDIELLIESEAFPSDTKIRHFDHTVQSDFTCPTWVALTKYPFLLRLKYPFTWYCCLILRGYRVFVYSDHANDLIDHVLSENKGTEIDLGEPAPVYEHQTFGYSGILT